MTIYTNKRHVKGKYFSFCLKLSKANPSLSVVAGVFRDHSYNFCDTFSLSLGHQNSFFTKIQAIITAIEFAHSNGRVDLWTESDSSSTLSCIQNTSYSPPWQLRSL